MDTRKSSRANENWTKIRIRQPETQTEQLTAKYIERGSFRKIRNSVMMDEVLKSEELCRNPHWTERSQLSAGMCRDSGRAWKRSGASLEQPDE